MSSVVKYFIGQSTLMTDFGGVDVENDCEGYLQGHGEETQGAMEGNKEPVHAVFITGSFPVYVSFYCAFFPRMTGFSAGSHFYSIAARMRSCSLPSNHKEMNLVWSISAKIQWKQLPLLAH